MPRLRRSGGQRGDLVFALILGLSLTALMAAASSAQAQDDGVDEDEPSFEPAEGLQSYIALTTKITEATRDTAASVAVISQEQIQRAGFTSVGEALASVPGLYVTYDLQNYHVAMRGVFGGVRAGSRFLKIMIDGESVSFVQTGTYYLGPELIPMSAIERIEILRGPSSALYGTGAFSGAVNVVTKRAPYEGETTVGASALLTGSVLGQRGAAGELKLQITGKRGYLMAAISGGRTDRSGLQVPEESPFSGQFAGRKSERDYAAPRSAFVRGDAHLGGGRLRGIFVASRHDVRAEFHDLSVLTHNTRVSVSQYTASLAYDKPFASGVALRLSGGFASGGPNDRDHFLLETTDSEIRKREFGYTEYRGAGELRYEFGDGGYALAGVDLSLDNEELNLVSRVDTETGRVTKEAKPQARQISNIGVMSQLLLPATDWLKIAAAVRLDQHQITGPALSARIATVSPIGERTAIKLILARSFRAPSAEQLFGVPLSERDIKGVETLPEQLQHGVEVVLETFPATWLSLSAAAYYNRLTDALTYVLVGGRSIATPFQAQSFGGELVLRSSNDLGGIQVQPTLAATFQKTLTEEKFVDGFFEKAVPDDEGIPTLTINAKINLKIRPAHLNVFIDYRYVGERVPSQSNLAQGGFSDLSKPGYTLGAYSQLNLAISNLPIKINESIEVVGTLRLSNALDSRYSEIGFNGVDVPTIGRTAWFNLAVTL